MESIGWTKGRCWMASSIFLQTVGVALLEPVQGAAIQGEIIAFVQYVLFYRLKTPLFRLNAAKSDHVRFVHAGSLPPHTPDAL